MLGGWGVLGGWVVGGRFAMLDRIRLDLGRGRDLTQQRLQHPATAIDVSFPEIAEVLRVYGNGRAADAEARLHRTLHR
ncbi:hypothetical protein [Actinomadura gamaensis]|uniref:Uncharacterized protein n=1 Tax=Actinomadura gamaensis TaxID=1763541 RepID=A0ABV9U495_9ACTN